MLDYLYIGREAAEEIISNRYLQSADFEQARQLLGFLRGEDCKLDLLPSLNLISVDNGNFLIGNSKVLQNALIIDLKNAPIATEYRSADTIILFQRLLRFCVRYWTHQGLSRNEKLLPNSSKAIVFPFPISSRTSYRISIEREPDQKRMAKRGGSETYLLAYKSGTKEGDGPDEIADLAQFRKALSHFSTAVERAELARVDEAGGEGIQSLKVSTLDTIDSGPISPYIGFDNWIARLTDPQRGFVQNTFTAAHRIEGAAGTGKTLCLVLKCIYQIKKAEKNSLSYKACFVAHSEATAENIRELFVANGDEKYLESEYFDGLRSVEVTTLQRLCSKLLGTKILETELLDLDAMDSKIFQSMIIEEAFSEIMSKDFATHSSFMSSEFRKFLEKEDKLQVSRMLQHEISVVIKGRAGEDFDKYLKLPRLAYGIPVKSRGDKGFVFVVFNLYQEKLRNVSQYDTDDVVLSTVGQLNTPIWRRRREREGYDGIFVDETHLFNMNELSVFHYLTKSDGPHPIAYSVDRTQAIGDRGWGDGAISAAIAAPSTTEGESEKTLVSSIFRCAPKIVELAFSVTSSGASLFVNFENPLEFASSAFTNEEEEKSCTPVYRQYSNDELMVVAAFDRAQALANDLSCSRGEILIVAFDPTVLSSLEAVAKTKNKPISIINRRGDVQVVQDAVTSGRFVLGHAEYVGGLEFQAAVLVGVDGGRLPPSAMLNGDSANFLSYSSHNLLYVAISRARYRVELMGVESRGESSLLQAGLSIGALLRA